MQFSAQSCRFGPAEVPNTLPIPKSGRLILLIHGDFKEHGLFLAPHFYSLASSSRHGTQVKTTFASLFIGSHESRSTPTPDSNDKVC